MITLNWDNVGIVYIYVIQW